MQGIVEAIKYLYQQFILRDVVAYVAPGTLLIGCVLWVVLGTRDTAALIPNIPAIAYLPIYGLVFITGLALENLGEMIGVLRFHNRPAECGKRPKGRNRPDDKEHFRVLQKFHQITSAQVSTEEGDGYGPWLERTRERITVKKYASGNIAMAILISMILMLVTNYRPDWKLKAIVVVGAILIVSLLRAHWYQLNLQVIWEDEAVKPYEQDKTGSTLPSPQKKHDDHKE
jgi:hypothetical protein